MRHLILLMVSLTLRTPYLMRLVFLLCCPPLSPLGNQQSPDTTCGFSHMRPVYSHSSGTVTHVHRLPLINHCDRQVPRVQSKRCVCRAGRWGSNLRGGRLVCLVFATVHRSCPSYNIRMGGTNRHLVAGFK